MRAIEFRKRLNRIWESSWLFSEQLEKRLIERSLAEAADFASGDLLDIGCGHKPYRTLLGDRIDRHIGVDYPITVGQHMSSGYVEPDIDIFGAGEALPIRTGSMDTVLCTQVLEHTPEPDHMMAEMARVLKPGGHLILTAPQEWGLHQEPHDYYRYTRYGLDHLATKHHLKVEYIRQRGGLWIVLGQRLSAYIYDTFSRPLRRRGKRLLFALSAIITLPTCAITQLLALALDRLQPIQTNTLGYIMVATKPGRDES